MDAPAVDPAHLASERLRVAELLRYCSTMLRALAGESEAATCAALATGLTLKACEAVSPH